MAHSEYEYAAPDLAEKCKHCHLFIEENASLTGMTPEAAREFRVAEFLHLYRGDDADEKIEGTHDAEPSGMIATLSVWREFGPLEMRMRFTEGIHALTVESVDDDGWDEPGPGEPPLDPVQGWCSCREGREDQWGYASPDREALYDAWLSHVSDECGATRD